MKIIEIGDLANAHKGDKQLPAHGIVIEAAERNELCQKAERYHLNIGVSVAVISVEELDAKNKECDRMRHELEQAQLRAEQLFSLIRRYAEADTICNRTHEDEVRAYERKSGVAAEIIDFVRRESSRRLVLPMKTPLK